jgi:hypothetical protein
MKTTQEVLTWFGDRGIRIEAADIVWYWKGRKLWFILNQDEEHDICNTESGLVDITHTHRKDGSSIIIFEPYDEIAIEKAPAGFRKKLEAYEAAKKISQTERLTDMFHQARKAKTLKQAIEFGELAASVSSGMSKEDIAQCRNDAEELAEMEGENEYCELDLIKAILNGDVDAVEYAVGSLSYELNSTYSPLHMATICGNSKIVSILIEDGANVNQKDSNSVTALHYSTYMDIDDPIAVVTALIEAGADVNAVEDDLMTPLHLVAANGHHHIAQLLIGAGAYIEEMDVNGETPLTLAVAGNHTEIVAALIQSGADINSKNCNGLSSLETARKKRYTEIIEILLKAGATDTL